MDSGLPQDPGTVVLVVDDDDELRQSLIDVLATGGVRAIGARRSDEALELHAAHEPAVVVCDYRLPDGSGIELARQVKARDPETPVLLLTGYASLDSAVAAVGQLDAYLIKPVASQTFMQTVRNALARRGLVAENKNLVERLQRLNAYQALYDPLTGLPNRALLDDRLSQAIASCRRTGLLVGVLFVDLDGFKVVNDLFGHHVGDQLLKLMADRLADARRQSDTVARFGGDEFVVVCPDLKTSAAACRVAEHLLDELSLPAEVEGVEHRLTASVGIALTGPGPRAESPETLLRNADTAMYRAKEEGRAGWELFDDAMRDRVLERYEVEHGLRAGMQSGDLAVVYQPLVDLSSGALVGAEALLRWYRKGHGTLLPATFLNVAEESGLIVPIGRWALEQALSDLARWRDEHVVPERFRLWVNVSPHQVANPHFGDLVAELLDGHDLSPALVGLEIVERDLRDVGGTVKVLRALRELGVSLNLDDFGAGYSNLAWLQELPITGIKIDRRFVSSLDVVNDRRGTAIVDGLIRLGHALGLSIVGEGVETPAQASSLQAMGCELAQGYYFGYPGSGRELWGSAPGRHSDPQAADDEQLSADSPTGETGGPDAVPRHA
ncbi:MAG TPA: EAL domain-containing protein [Acidimicrobiales bacterium]|nr:EAL domain-containing protein [Acidimicrobiales bacterium]